MTSNITSISYAHFVGIYVSRNEENVGVRCFVHHLLGSLLNPPSVRAFLLWCHLIKFEVVLFEPSQYVLHLLGLASTFEVDTRPFTKDDDVRRPQNGLFHPVKNLEFHSFGVYEGEVDNSIRGKHVINLINLHLLITIGISIII